MAGGAGVRVELVIERVHVPDEQLDKAEAEARTFLLDMRKRQHEERESARRAHVEGRPWDATRHARMVEAYEDGPIRAAVDLLVHIDMRRPMVFRVVATEVPRRELTDEVRADVARLLDQLGLGPLDRDTVLAAIGVPATKALDGG